MNRDKLAKQILGAIRETSPITYRQIMSRVEQPDSLGMVGDFLGKVLDGLNKGAQVYSNVQQTRNQIEQQKIDRELAKQRALQVIEAEQRQREYDISLAQQSAARARATAEQLRAEAELQRSHNELEQIKQSLTQHRWQRLLLWGAGGLGALLVVKRLI